MARHGLVRVYSCRSLTFIRLPPQWAWLSQARADRKETEECQIWGVRICVCVKPPQGTRLARTRPEIKWICHQNKSVSFLSCFLACFFLDVQFVSWAWLTNWLTEYLHYLHYSLKPSSVTIQNARKKKTVYRPSLYITHECILHMNTWYWLTTTYIGHYKYILSCWFAFDYFHHSLKHETKVLKKCLRSLFRM